MQARIAMISEHASPLAAPGSVDSGGQNVYVAQVARHLAELGLQVDVFTRRDSADQSLVQAWLPGVRVIHVPVGPPTFVPKEKMLPLMEPFTDFMTSFMRTIDYSCIHANFFMSAHVGCQLKRRLAVPLVVTFHALGKVRRLHQASADEFPIERLHLEEQAMRQADVIVAECPADRSDQIQLYGADSQKIRIVACGFDSAEVWPMDKREACRQLKIAPEPFTVLQLGRMVPRKGVDDVIRGFGLAIRRGLHGRLIIVGCDVPGCPTKSQELARLSEIARQYGIVGEVHFAGQCPRSDIRKYYGACDVFVTAPWYEPFGITPLEAMACGRPVIGSKVGGIQYSVRDGITGFHVPPRDPEAIAQRLLQLYANPSLLTAMAHNALRWVHAQFTWRQVAEELADIYGQLSDDHQQRHRLSERAASASPTFVSETVQS